MTMVDKGYNGWKNYETWAMALWIDNDQESYNYVRGYLSQEAADCCKGTDRQPIGYLADLLKDWAEDGVPDLAASVWSDLLGAAFGAIDWYEIAANLLSEIAEVPA